MIWCRMGRWVPAPCWDDLCHSGEQTLCGIWAEELDAVAAEDVDDDWDDDDWGEP